MKRFVCLFWHSQIFFQERKDSETDPRKTLLVARMSYEADERDVERGALQLFSLFFFF